MTTYKVRAYTGPAIVEQIADKLRSHGFEVSTGTETVYFYSEGDSKDNAADNAERDVRRIYPHAGFRVFPV